MDNAPAHPPSLKDQLLDEFKFIEVRFLPPNTTPLLQPMDQQVISNFKKIYIKELFQRCFELTEETNLTLREFWQNHFNIVHCLKIIDKAWNGVSQRTLVSAWTKLWPHIVHAYDFKGLSGEQEPPIIDVIVSLGKTLGLEVNEPIIQELVEEEDQELTTNELIDLHREQHQEVKEVISSGEEEDDNSLGSLPSDQIREICKMWETMSRTVLAAAATTGVLGYFFGLKDTSRRANMEPGIMPLMPGSKLMEASKYGLPSRQSLRVLQGYIVAYDQRTRIPSWVFEHLTPESLRHGGEGIDRSKSEFHEDSHIHQFFRAVNADYKGSGYDRGHMAAAGNHRSSQQKLDETFLLTNMAPQEHLKCVCWPLGNLYMALRLARSVEALETSDQ
ncbi:hypothetical protein LAZ67_4001663 [Cordylochernes scorpioides]|uniref:Endonuclease n=1 Tax=Cordylochernes scorpioides TaxID=51811 RepID=A0ABY6KF83_9ARAC|nr:hypothetical protein LAZ67_4001663 [Cordylochernes scorpioides]